jgi:Cu(I)/Ag(I) efflux system membrane fusion protein
MTTRIFRPAALARFALMACLCLAAWFVSGCRKEGGPTPAAAAQEKTYYHCAMHPWYIADKPGHCPICGMELVKMDAAESAHMPAGGGPIRIDPAVIQNMGVRTEAVARRDLASEVRAPGQIQVDEARVAQVNARVMGYAEKLYANVTGQRVVKGGPLLELYSPDLASAQQEYLEALRYARAEGHAAGGGELAESARRRLMNWGMSAADIAALARGGAATSTFRLASPLTGVVLDKKVVRGQNVAPGMELYTVADLSKVWAVARVYQGDLAVVRPSGDAEVELAYLPGKPFRGKVVFVSPTLDPAARTAEVRVELANTPDLALKPEMLATVILKGAVRKGVLAVPEQALIRSGRRTLAVVALGGGYFEPREVVLGASAGGYVEVTQGLAEGDGLVVSSQFLIDSESNLKAAVQRMQASQAASAQPAENAAAPGPDAAPAPEKAE